MLVSGLSREFVLLMSRAFTGAATRCRGRVGVLGCGAHRASFDAGHDQLHLIVSGNLLALINVEVTYPQFEKELARCVREHIVHWAQHVRTFLQNADKGAFQDTLPGVWRLCTMDHW